MNTNVCCFDVGVSSSPINRTICSFLVHFLILLVIQTFNVSEIMIFKCVSLVQILLFVALMCAYLSCQAIKPFLHSSVHFLLFLANESFNLNDDLIFKCDSLVRILTLDVFMWVCLPHPVIRSFVHF